MGTGPNTVWRVTSNPAATSVTVEAWLITSSSRLMALLHRHDDDNRVHYEPGPHARFMPPDLQPGLTLNRPIHVPKEIAI